MSLSVNYPTIAPSLDLDFANTRKLDPRITFTRASTGTYYDNVTTTKAEENFYTYSQEFDNAAWGKQGSTVTDNTTAAPDGTTTADTINEGTTANYHNINTGGTITLVAGQIYTISIFAKNIDAQYLFLSAYLRGLIGSSNYASASFDLSTGATSTTAQSGTGFSVISSSITSVVNNWYRCTMVFTVGSTAAVTLNFGLGTSGTIGNYGLQTYTGTSRSIYLWGAQLEQRSTVTSYTPTTTQPITNYIPVLLTAAANVARFDCNPVTRESLGLLVEEQRTNLLTYSEQFDNAAWSKLDSSVQSNVIVSPDGTLTGDILVDNTNNAQHFIRESFSATSGSTYTLSVFAKSAGRFLILSFYPNATFGGSGAGAYFNLVTGTVGNTFGTVTTSITPVGNGWYRCVISAAATATGTANASIGLSANGSQSTYTGDGYSGIYIWGAQLEAGAFPTSYIPTVASQVTRAADAASMTGGNFSSWYNPAEGTLYAEVSYFGNLIGSAAGANNIAINDGTGNNVITLRTVRDSTNPQADARIRANNVTYVDTAGLQPIAANTFYKRALYYSSAGARQAINGSFDGTETTNIVIPVVNQLSVPVMGSDIIAAMNIKRLAYYPLRLTNNNLQALTS